MDIEEIKMHEKGPAEAMIRTTVTLAPLLYRKAKEYHIKVSEATRVGISILLAERGVEEYNNELNLFRRMKEWQKKAEEYSQRFHELQDKRKAIG